MATALSQAQLDAMIRAQLAGVDPSEPLPSNPDLVAALQNASVEAATLAANLNASLVAFFNNAWNNFLVSVGTGKLLPTAANAPKPSFAYIAAQASDGWTFVIQGPDPVTAQPPLPQAPLPPPPMPIYIPNVGQAIVAPAGSPLAVGSTFTQTYQGVSMTFVVESDTDPFGTVIVWRRTA